MAPPNYRPPAGHTGPPPPYRPPAPVPPVPSALSGLVLAALDGAKPPDEGQRGEPPPYGHAQYHAFYYGTVEVEGAQGREG